MKKRNIKLFNTYINKPLALKYVKEIFNNTLLNEGYLVKKFEDVLAKKFKFRNCTSVNSGTAALHLVLKNCGIGKGDEVILPAQTFISTGLAVLYTGATPIFADIEYNTGNIDINSIVKKITSKTKMILPVHWGGLPCNLSSIDLIRNAQSSNQEIFLVDDCAHALGAKYHKQYIGSSILCDFSCFSFQSIKHLTTGDGGLITSKNNMDQIIKNRWFGIDRQNDLPDETGERKYDIETLGYKYHMNNYDACLGLANLVDYEKRISYRTKIAKFYHKELKKIDGITLLDYFKNPENKSSFWLYGFHVNNRNEFIQMLKLKGVESSIVHCGIDRNKIFGGKDMSLTNQRNFERSYVNIPIHENVSFEDAQYIVDCIKNGW